MPDAGANLSEHNQIIALQTRIEEMADARQAEDDRWRKTATDTLGTLQFAVAKLETTLLRVDKHVNEQHDDMLTVFRILNGSHDHLENGLVIQFRELSAEIAANRKNRTRLNWLLLSAVFTTVALIGVDVVMQIFNFMVAHKPG